MKARQFVDRRGKKDKTKREVSRARQTAEQRIYIGDCRQVLRSLPDKSVHLVVTSPPYNVGKDYGGWNDRMKFKEYLEFTKGWLTECFRVLVDGGRICVNLPVWKYKNHKANLMFEYYQIMRQIGFQEREVIFWVKLFGLDFASSNKIWGKPTPHNPFMNYPCEVILVMNKNGRRLKGKHYDLSKGEFYKWRRNVWFMTPEYNRTHPAPYPEELPRRVIKFFSFVGQTVLDPFLGSGTTMKVASKLGRNSIGIELNRKFVEMARNRVGGAEVIECEEKEADDLPELRCEVCGERVRDLELCAESKKFICRGCCHCQDGVCMGEGVCWEM